MYATPSNKHYRRRGAWTCARVDGIQHAVERADEEAAKDEVVGFGQHGQLGRVAKCNLFGGEHGQRSRSLRTCAAIQIDS